LFTVKELEEFSAAIATCPTLIGIFIKTINFIYKKDDIESLMNKLKKIVENNSRLEKSGNGQKLEGRIKQISKIFKSFLTVTVFSIFMEVFVPFSTHKQPLKLWFPFDHQQNEVVFWAVVVYEYLEGFIYAPVTIIMDTFPVFFISFVIGLIEELSKRLKNIGKNSNTDKNDDRNLKELLECIELQLQLKALIKDIQDIFAKIIWAQGFMSSIIICTTSFTLTTSVVS
jgi:7tm Odorant receptor